MSTTEELDSISWSENAEITEKLREEALGNEIYEDIYNTYAEYHGLPDLQENFIDDQLGEDGTTDVDGQDDAYVYAKNGMGKTSVMIVYFFTVFAILVFIYQLFRIVFREKPRHFYNMDGDDHLNTTSDYIETS